MGSPWRLTKCPKQNEFTSLLPTPAPGRPSNKISCRHLRNGLSSRSSSEHGCHLPGTEPAGDLTKRQAPGQDPASARPLRPARFKDVSLGNGSLCCTWNPQPAPLERVGSWGAQPVGGPGNTADPHKYLCVAGCHSQTPVPAFWSSGRLPENGHSSPAGVWLSG